MVFNGKIVDHFVVWLKYIPSLQPHLGKEIYAKADYAGKEIALHLVPMAGNQPGWRSDFNFGNDRSKDNWKEISIHIDEEKDTVEKGCATQSQGNSGTFTNMGYRNIGNTIIETIKEACAHDEISVVDCLDIIELLTSRIRSVKAKRNEI